MAGTDHHQTGKNMAMASLRSMRARIDLGRVVVVRFVGGLDEGIEVLGVEIGDFGGMPGLVEAFDECVGQGASQRFPTRMADDDKHVHGWLPEGKVGCRWGGRMPHRLPVSA
jgi:hypothetical protein